jgi:hypothetical protein
MRLSDGVSAIVGTSSFQFIPAEPGPFRGGYPQMSMLKVLTTFTGWPGAPGLQTHYLTSTIPNTQESANLAHDRVVNALTACAGLFPPNVHWTTQALVEEIEQTNGNLLGQKFVTDVAGQGSGAAIESPQQVQMVVSWRTDGVVNSRRVRGRTFLGPLAADTNTNQGTPNAGAIQKALDFANSMGDAGTTDMRHIIWHRPTAGGSDGSHHDVIQGVVRPVYGTLRSRRD